MARIKKQITYGNVLRVKCFLLLGLRYYRWMKMDENVNTLDEKFIPMLERIREMFLEFGLKNLNMDEISRKLGISKKTLYRYVDSKESLIEKVFEFENLKWNKFFEELSQQSYNAIERLFRVSLRVHEEMKDINPMLMFELKKYYEPAFNEYLSRKRAAILNKMRMNLEQGISEGLYRPDLNIELILTLYVNYLVEMHNYDMAKMSNITFDQVFEVMFENHIRAISTSKGVKYFEKRKREISDNLIRNNNL
jgi:TetR/AcrR family transcriptional regulator, cholesterol catabolism regulator